MNFLSEGFKRFRGKEAQFPSDQYFQGLKRRLYLNEAAMVGACGISSDSVIRMFHNVWDHNIPVAVAWGLLAVTAFTVGISGSKREDRLFQEYEAVTRGIGEIIAAQTQISEKAALLGLKKDNLPSDRLLASLLRSAKNRMNWMIMSSPLLFYTGTDIATNSNAQEGLLRVSEAEGVMALIVMAGIHRSWRTAINQLGEEAFSRGVIERARENDAAGNAKAILPARRLNRTVWLRL